MVAGLAGGAVDLLYASGLALWNGNPVTRPWQAVASGWIGREAGHGGAGVIALGVGTHFGIATCMAAVYVLLVRRIPVVVARPYATAVLYGLILYAVMYLGVLPLRWPEAFPKWNGVMSVLDVLAHIGVALAIAWAAARPARAINPKSATAGPF
ncbi:MAG: hypothetical protein KKA30_12625 [Alphaproteobacteria bacterium]|nr:hypothetical protein [Alphaproteobacteria bacterium]